MKLSDITRFILLLSRQLIAGVLRLIPDSRAALRKPAVTGHILLGAHRAQITLVALLAFMILVAPGVVDFITGAVFPAETSKKVFGLVKTRHAHPWKDTSYMVIMSVLWLGSALSALMMLWLHIPRGLASANARARNLVLSGEDESDPIKRKALYNAALALAADTNLESELATRLRKIAETPAEYTATEITTPDDSSNGGQTLINPSYLPPRGEPGSAQNVLEERYTLGPQLGKGAMGVVFSARDKVLDRKVAIKQLALILSGDDEYTSRFRREAKVLAQLTHPNVVQVYDLIEDGCRLWMVLEYVEGGDLAAYLRENGQLSAGTAANIITSVAEGLAFAHDQGIVHRDLKPANILLTPDRMPKISDFGIAKLSQTSKLTQAGSVLGSPPYMSPEQCSGGAVDTRTDIYALGITLYELLSGKVPFEGETSSVLARHIIEQPVPLSELRKDVPLQMERLVAQMLAKKPVDRPSDMAEVIETLSVFSTDRAATSRA